MEEHVEPGIEIESAADARRFCCVPVCSIPRFSFMAAPKFFAAAFANRVAKIASGPINEIK